LNLRGKREPLRAATLLLATGRLIAAFMVAAVNVFLHGFALLFLRRYWLAAGFFAIEVVCYLIIRMSEMTDPMALPWSYWGGGLVFWINCFASQLVACRAAGARDDTVQSLLHFRGVLRLMMFVANAFSTCLLFHGFAHLMVKRTRRGLV